MQKIINITLKAAAAVLVVILAAGCVFEKENPVRTQENYKYVLVQLGVNTDSMVQTKADGDIVDGGTNAGTSVETAINTLRVYAYTNVTSNGSTAKRLCGYLYVEDLEAAATASAPLLMDIKVPFNEYGSTQQVYFMAVANAEGMTAPEGILINSIGRAEDGSLILPQSFGFDNFAELQYSVTNQNFTNGMPMYCQTSAAVQIDLSAQGTEQSVPGHNGHEKLPVKVTLDLTRSLSKIEVYAAEIAAQSETVESTNVEIKNVQFINVPQSGYLFDNDAPQGIQYASAAATLMGEGAVVNKVNQSSTADIQNPSKYTQVTAAYYLAENLNGEDDIFSYGETTADATLATEAGSATALKITYNVGGDDKYGYVVMPKILRNTNYKVLCRVKANGKLALTLVVKDWTNGGKVDVDFNDVVAHDESYGFKWFKGETEVTNNVVNGTYTFSSAANDEVTCKFKLTAPIGGKWYATLTGGDIQKYSIVGGTGDIEGGEMSFTIKTLTNNFDGESANQVNLVITAVNTVGKSNVVDDFNYIIKQSQTN